MLPGKSGRKLRLCYAYIMLLYLRLHDGYRSALHGLVGLVMSRTHGTCVCLRIQTHKGSGRHGGS